MTYRLSKVSQNSSIVKFHILDDFGIAGSVSCKPEDEGDLLSHWKDAPRAAAIAAARGKNPMVAAMLAGKKYPFG